MPDTLPTVNNKLYRTTELPMNSVDALVRHAPALQQTGDVADGAVRLNTALATSLGLNGSGKVEVQQQGTALELEYLLDDRVPDNTVLIHAAHASTVSLGAWFSDISIRKV